MTVEEKANAYDEAIAKAQKELQSCGSKDCDAARQIYRFFPELKEPEDERMKKAIIHILYENYTDAAVIEGVEIAEIVAWLEKQGESKFYSWKPTKEQYEALDYAYNSCADTAIGNYYEGVLETLIDDLHRLEKQGQKPKWSENDEHHWMMCVVCVEECATQEREDFSKTIDWLKSLKQRLEVKQDESR
jgi:hypothetical protein